MSAQLKEFLKRVFSLRNIVPLIIIAVAFTGTFVPSPFGIQRDQILLALLAFLAIDSLLERIEMLSNIENDIKHVKLLAESQLSGKGMLRRRSDFPRVEHMIAEVKQELFITGITLDIMSTITGLFEQKAQQGVRIKFLGINPGGEIIEEISKYSGFEREELVARVKSNLNKIYRIAQRFPNSIELRVISHRLANGYFVADPNIDQGYMTVTPYFFQISDSQFSPVLYLSKKMDDHWYKIYLDDFERLWSNAIQWPPIKTDNSVTIDQTMASN